jgi:hypothetical protein
MLRVELAHALDDVGAARLGLVGQLFDLARVGVVERLAAVQRLAQSLEQPGPLLRVGVAEEVGDHLAEGRRFLRAERVREPVAQRFGRLFARDLFVIARRIARRLVETGVAVMVEDVAQAHRDLQGGI